MKRRDAIIILIILVLIVFGIGKSGRKVVKLDTSKVTNSVKKEQFAYYLKNNQGDYEKVTDNDVFPLNHTINQEKTFCTDLNGNKINVNLEIVNGKVTVTSNKTVYCYLYFDEQPTSVVTYWTYEGGYTTSGTATNKVADYRDLNKNYFIKETATQAVAEEDLYKYQEYIDGELDYDDDGQHTLTECQGMEYEDDSENYGTCVRIIEANETYTKKEYEVCTNYGNTLICMKNTDWANSETLRTRFVEEAGLTCAYYNGSTWVGNTKPENGILRCSEEDPTNLSAGEFYCGVNSNGTAYCNVNGEAFCYVDDDSANCGG